MAPINQLTVWKEAFDNEVAVAYTTEQPSSNNINYSVDDLKTHSWAFWFKQTDHSSKNAATNNINSYLDIDDALLIMKYSDWLLKDGGTLLDSKNHYNRNVVTAITPTNRTPGKLADDIPALLQLGERKEDYERNDLTNPVGMQSHSFYWVST